ncbi:unnamed protein product [Heterobilharzia americana]|nr:unnamed protein product [Heterobilharzia americana]
MIEPGPVLTTEEKEDLSNQVIDAMCEDVKQEISEPSTNECPEAENEKNPDETSDSTDEDDNADGDDAQEDVEIDDQDQPADAETNKSDDEEDVSNLQIAWEVIEVARKIFSQKQDPEDKLNVAECLQKLGEISREKEDYDQAVSDLKECLEIRTAVLGTKDRRVAESHYQLGTTYAVFGDLEKASISFRTSVDCLKLLADDVRMKIGATDENDEVKNRLRITLEELELLIPDIEKRCADIDEDRLSAGLKSDEPLVEQCSNGSSVPTEDISHLVRKKRLTVDVVEKPKEDENSESNGHDHPKSKKTKLVDANENGVPVENGV